MRKTIFFNLLGETAHRVAHRAARSYDGKIVTGLYVTTSGRFFRGVEQRLASLEAISKEEARKECALCHMHEVDIADLLDGGFETCREEDDQ